MNKKIPIFYSALLLTSVNLLLRFVSTGFQVYLSSEIGASGIGLLQLVLSIGGLSMTVAMAGIRTATMYLTAEQLGKQKPGNVRWVLAGCVRYSLVCSLMIAILVWYFAPMIAKHWVGDAATTGAVRLFACFLVTNCLCGVMVGYFTAANKIGTLAIVEICEQACSMLLTVVLLKTYAVNDTVRACGAVIMGSGISGCLTLVCLVALRMKEPSFEAAPVSMKRKLMETAVPLALADNLKSGISTAENLMVPKRLSLHSAISDPLAAFGTVCGMVFPVLMFPAAILYGLSELLIPELARCVAAESNRRIRYLARRSLQIAILYGCFFCGLLFLLSDELCMMLYQNTEAGTYLKYFSLLVPMLYCDAITDAMVKGLGQQTASVRYNIITSSMDIALLYVLLPSYGMLGYYVSFTVTHFLNFVLSIRRLLKLTGKLLPIKIPMCTLISMSIAIAICRTIVNPVYKSTAYVLLLGSLLYLLRVISSEEIVWLKSLVINKESHNGITAIDNGD